MSLKTVLHAVGKIGTAIDVLCGVGSKAAGILVIIAGLLTTYEVVMRYFLNRPTVWSFHVTMTMLVWIAFISAAGGQKQGSHIYVDLLVAWLSPKTRTLLQVITTCLSLLFVALLFYWSAHFLADVLKMKEKLVTPLFAMPKALPVSALAIGMGLLFLQLLRQLFERASGLRHLPSEQFGGARRLIDNPYFLLPVFIAVSVWGIWLITDGKGAAGVLILLLSLLFAGQPIAWCLGLSGCALLFFGFGGSSQLIQISRIGYAGMDNFVLVAVPLFILAGALLEKGGVAEELYTLATRLVGHLPGGTGVATIFACAIFAACNGSSSATAAAIGAVALQSMRVRKYDKRLIYGTIAAGGTLGILIPPSNPMIIYGAITDESVGACFMAGLIPGILLATLFSIWIIIDCKRTGRYEKVAPYSWRERFSALVRSGWGLVVPVLIMGTIFLGVATPTESAALAVVYAIVMLLVRRRIRMKDILDASVSATSVTTMVFMIIVGALILGQGTIFLRIPHLVADWVIKSGISAVGALTIVMVGYVILGMFLEIISILYITLPVVYPLLVTHFGLNGIWFAVLMVINMEMALITPPVGINLFVIQGMAKERLIEVVRGVIPFFFLMVIALLLVALVPQLALWLPSFMR